MHDIPIFDSLTHPTINGNWLKKKYDGLNDPARLIEQMDISGIQWAFAVGMGPVGGYQEAEYAGFIKQASDRLFPVAFIAEEALSKPHNVYLQSLKDLGYVGIKIHPRLSGIGYDHPRLADFILQADALKLPVFCCTYFWDKSSNAQSIGLNTLLDLLSRVRNAKIILLHGGAVRLLELAEVVRAFDNLLLDLSSTLCKYEGSSIDMDISYLFRFFDQRICIGSDGPEYLPSDLRRRFSFFAHGVEKSKANNIAFGNLAVFTGFGSNEAIKN